MRFDENYIYPDDKGNLRSPEDKGTHRTLLPYEVELLDGLAKLIEKLFQNSIDDLLLFLELKKDDFICYRTAKRLGIPRYKAEKLLERLLKISSPK